MGAKFINDSKILHYNISLRFQAVLFFDSYIISFNLSRKDEKIANQSPSKALSVFLKTVTSKTLSLSQSLSLFHTHTHTHTNKHTNTPDCAHRELKIHGNLKKAKSF